MRICKYCKEQFDNKPIVTINDPVEYDTEFFKLWIEEGKLRIDAHDNYFFYLDEQVGIKYCPKCGRKLNNEKINS